MRFVYVEKTQLDDEIQIIQRAIITSKEVTFKKKYNFGNIVTFSYPLAIDDESAKKKFPLSFYKHYKTFNEPFYLQDYIFFDSVKNARSYLSLYSVVFFQGYTPATKQQINQTPFSLEDINNGFTNVEGVNSRYLSINDKYVSTEDNFVLVEYGYISVIQTNRNKIPHLREHFDIFWRNDILNCLSIPPRSRIYLFEKADYNGQSITYDNPSNMIQSFSWGKEGMKKINSYIWITHVGDENPYLYEKDVINYYPQRVGAGVTLSKERPSIMANINVPAYKFVEYERQEKTVLNTLEKY